MYCEVSIICKKDLPADLSSRLQTFFSHVPSPQSLSVATATFPPGSDYIVQYGSISPAIIFAVWRGGPSELKAHVRSTINQDSYPELKRCIRDVRKSLVTFLKRSNNSEVMTKVQIWNGDQYLLSGTSKTALEQIKGIALDRLLYKVASVVAIFSFSYVFTTDWKKSLINLIAIILVSFVWILSPLFKKLLGVNSKIFYEG